MAVPRASLLSGAELETIHEASLKVLATVGVRVPHPDVLRALADDGAHVEPDAGVVRLPEAVVTRAVASAGKQYVLHGRDPRRVARYGFGDFNLMSSPGQFAWLDDASGQRRAPCLADARDAVRLGDALEHVTVVGAMAVPDDVPAPVRDVVITAALIRGSTKPTRTWPVTRQSTEYVLRMYEAVAGGAASLRAKPMIETFLEPISPLSFPATGLDVLWPFLERGQPVSIGPMAMVTGTGPGTLAGTVVQENAEILAGIAIVQAIAPGTPVMYGGIPHVLDPRTSICSFGAPEQGIMALAMAQLGKWYGFPVYVNTGLTDAKALDAQAGVEKASSLLLSALAGADTVGHGGIVGPDQGGSLAWLVVDDALMAFAKRVARGFDVTPETLAADVIARVGPGGTYLDDEHTAEHFRRELLLPDARWSRDLYGHWLDGGSTTMGERARDHAARLVAGHEVARLDPALDAELDRIEEAARRDLLGLTG